MTQYEDCSWFDLMAGIQDQYRAMDYTVWVCSGGCQPDGCWADRGVMGAETWAKLKADIYQLASEVLDEEV